MNVLNMMGVTTSLIYPTLVSVSVCVRNNMADRRDNVLEEKPTLSELCEHIHIGS